MCCRRPLAQGSGYVGAHAAVLGAHGGELSHRATVLRGRWGPPRVSILWRPLPRAFAELSRMNEIDGVNFHVFDAINFIDFHAVNFNPTL
jgi:hypothetical protein